MRIGSSGPSDNPYLAHQSAFTADMVARAAPEATARVTTRDFGFSLGGFGLRYVSEDIHIDAEALVRQEEQRTAARLSRVFSDEMDVAQTRSLAVQSSARTADSASALGDETTFSPLARPAALAAYARSSESAAMERLPGRLLAVA